ncbi:MAG TPA: hypothetical protein VMF69_22600 [Gemmataceae bacterium]|nr:hypothetical protein [Gemmataceae bacterium]
MKTLVPAATFLALLLGFDAPSEDERPDLSRGSVIAALRPYDGPSREGVDVCTLTEKIMCGYQGWFTTPGDGSGRGWRHYSARGKFQPGSCGIDLWPDVSELDEDEKFPTLFRHKDDRVATVFSSHHPKTVLRHFRWMEQYGLDGVFVQRFAVEMFYQAMFDEMDEGTAIFKCTNDPPVGASSFLSLEGTPGDHYLWLAGMGGKLLRGEIAATDKLPSRLPDTQIKEKAPDSVFVGHVDRRTFDKTMPRAVLESYLARAISMEGLLNGKGDLDDNIRMLKSTGAKFIGRSLCLWAGEANLLRNLDRAKEQLPKVHQADPEMILQACIFEIVTTQVEQVPVPEWAFTALGRPVEKRNFRYADMLYPDGKRRDHWGKGASVPDVSQPETKLWFYFLARSYIDLGIEAIHFGQTELMNGNDRDLAHYEQLLTLIRSYAAKHARRHMVLCDAHVPSGGLVREGRLLLDFHSFPLRIREVPEKPQEAILQVGFSDSIYGRSKGGLTFSGWKCEHLPYLVEIDNWGVSRQPGKAKAGGIWVWGYDEISWFANQSKQYRSDWLRYAWDWVRRTDANGFLQMPGSRTMRSPLNRRRWYFANTPSPAVPDGLGDEETIRAIWTTDAAKQINGAATPTGTTFGGEKTTWHGFDRYDFLMDETALILKPIKARGDEKDGIKDQVKGKLRCVVVAPKQAAPGNPWSWRGYYFNHEPQAEIELLKRGFHIGFILSDAGKHWDAWYAFLTEKHGLSRKPAFVGMSRGGRNAFAWAAANPDKVSCIYTDNPAISRESLMKLGELAQRDIPLLHVCGSLDPILGRHTLAVENIYRQLGGRISVMIKEGAGHHPHSLRDPTPIADFIVRSQQPADGSAPAFAGTKFAKTAFYSVENLYRDFPKEGLYITCRGSWFPGSYYRYELRLEGITGAVTVIVPKREAKGKPWVFRADFLTGDAAIDLALLSKGFHIVTGPVPTNSDGPVLQQWNAVYKYLTDHGFSRKPILEGSGGAAGEAYAWAIANPDKVSCIYGENPLLRLGE